MSTKPSNRKTKTSASPTKRKAIRSAGSGRTRMTAAPSTIACKSLTKSRSKATLPTADIASTRAMGRFRDSKQAMLITRLRTLPGVTISQMMALTGWQAHTVRGAISGVLRKKMGLNVSCVKTTESGERLYYIADPRVSQ
ncbi:MAG TPA: hypothetical protein DCQ77_12200 [Betaproteobacteria bacterium]|nr:hypothetical protein [Betaproteobacteria bacterium]